ncbi:MAG TPA: hypothetical protein VHZ97_15145 [Pseudonocardiaceae bacterium]|jgi:hypothetical protein|nr:hypothetical protein [Pseudonocardiaceae bacterium]
MARRGPAGRPVVITVGVAVGLTLLALVGAILLRPRQPGGTADSGGAPSLPAANATLQCGNGPCRSLASTTVAGSSVQLLANADGSSGRVRIVTAQGLDSVFETTISQLGATLNTQSLTCVNASSPACMVSGGGPEGSAGEVFLQTDGDWERADAPYFASGNYISLRQGGTQGPEIITAQVNCDSDLSAQCTSAPVYVQVFAVAGATLGCSTPVSKLDKLPGWPNVTVSPSQLHACSSTN